MKHSTIQNIASSLSPSEIKTLAKTVEYAIDEARQQIREIPSVPFNADGPKTLEFGGAVLDVSTRAAFDETLDTYRRQLEWGIKDLTAIQRKFAPLFDLLREVSLEELDLPPALGGVYGVLKVPDDE